MVNGKCGNGRNEVVGITLKFKEHCGEDRGWMHRRTQENASVRQHEPAGRGLADEERFRLATEAMDGLVYDWDLLAGTARRSVGMASFLGWLPEEVPSDSEWWPAQIHPDDAAAVHRHFEEAVARQAKDCRQEYRFRHKDGHYLWIWDSNRIVYSAEGKPVRVIGCAVSIDERKRAEQELVRTKEELARVNAELETKVSERTAKLVEIVRELESWSYSIAHDLRAPLRSMRSFSSLLLDEYRPHLDSLGQEYLKRIDSAAMRMDAYLRDLLQYGKLGSGDFPLVTVDSGSLLDELVATYPNLQGPGIVIRVNRPLPRVQANVSALTQVFSNLMDNAVKFVEKGKSAEVVIRGEESDGWVRLWFEDNGIGIAPSARERIFEMFQRLHPVSLYDGTGMGLAIVRRAVQRMGGRVGVESAPGHGSRFWVELKAAGRK